MVKPHETVCILGMSYCGSTMLSGLMYNVPGAFSVGEAHWLLQRKDVPKLTACSLCGNDCKILGGITERNTTAETLYDNIAKAADADILVTSDKAKWTVEPYVPRQTAKAIILFRRPAAMLASGRRHDAGWDKTLGALYSEWYRGLLHWTEYWFKQRVVVSYERLALHTQPELERICNKLELPPPASPFVYPPPRWHNTGGNAHAWNWGHEGAKITLDDRWRVELKPEEVEALRQHEGCRSAYEQMARLAGE